MRKLAIFLLLALAADASFGECDFKCGDGRCLSAAWVCDNVKDCADGSDEATCSYLHACSPGEFMCRSGECIPAADKCNHVAECSDASDEKDCVPQVASTLIKLPSAEDFEDGMGHVEVTATPVQLSAQTTRKPPQCTPQSASFYFTNDDTAVFQMHTADALRSPKQFWRASDDKDMITSIAFDAASKELLLVNKHNPSRIKALDSKASARLFASHAHERFGRIAVDPVTGNIYFAENGRGIGACNQDMTACVPLVEADSPDSRYRDLILHPKAGQMFWIEDDMSATLKVSGMDGKKQRVLSHFEQVHAISLDAATDQLYIAEEEAIVVMDLKSLVRHEVAPLRTSAMVHVGCELIYIQRGHGSLRAYNMSSGQDTELVTVSGVSFQFAVVPDNSTADQPNPCRDMNCTELCVLTDDLTQPKAACVCKHCGAVAIEEPETSVFRPIVLTILVLLLLTLVAMAVVLYYRLWPALCDRLDALIGLQRRETHNISVGFKPSAVSEP